MNIYYVYILLCSDNSYYIGVTNNVEKRFYEHEKGLDLKCYTYKRRPVKLKFVENFSNINEAIRREKQIKGWTRKKKEVLIKRDFDKLIELAKCYSKSKSVEPRDSSTSSP